MIPELADDYAAFLKVDLAKELGPAKDSVEDMLTRLEEFQSLILMVQADGFQSVNSIAQEVLDRKDELEQLCKRVDGLECLVSRVKRDMDSLESLLNTAEADSGVSEGVIMKAFGSLFAKKPSVETAGGSRSALSAPFTPPEIFSSDDVFSSPPAEPSAPSPSGQP